MVAGVVGVVVLLLMLCGYLFGLFLHICSKLLVLEVGKGVGNFINILFCSFLSLSASQYICSSHIFLYYWFV